MTSEQLRLKKQELATQAENIKNACLIMRENNFRVMKPNRKKARKG